MSPSDRCLKHPTMDAGCEDCERELRHALDADRSEPDTWADAVAACATAAEDVPVGVAARDAAKRFWESGDRSHIEEWIVDA